MSILLDHQLREQINRNSSTFPVTFFCNELASLPDLVGPLHWHTDFEIASATSGVLDFQIGEQHIRLNAGESIFVNGNVMHGIKQLSGDRPDPIPNVVFSGEVIAPENSEIYRRYILPVAQCNVLPYVVFNTKCDWHNEVNLLIKDVYRQMDERRQCYEMAVQRDLSRIFEYIFVNFEDLPKSENTRIQINARIRIQKMLTCIRERYAEPLTLEDIASAANISRSEAGRCFRTYMDCSPVEALIRHRLQMARRLINDSTLSLNEISSSCGFNSVNYFIRQFRQVYGYTPGQHRLSGK